MEELWKKIYHQLKAELAAIRYDGWPGEEQIFQCFQICQRYLSQLHTCAGEAAKSLAFRQNILPYFFAEAEFIVYLSYAHLFCPAEPEGGRLFFEREKSRLARFQHQHRDVINQFEYRDKNCDYVTRSSLPENYETIISGYLALTRYIALLCEKFDQ